MQEPHAGGEGGRGEGCEEEGVVKPAERLRIHYAKLDHYAKREVSKKEDHRGVEDHCSVLGLILEGYSTGAARKAGGLRPGRVENGL